MHYSVAIHRILLGCLALSSRALSSACVVRDLCNVCLCDYIFLVFILYRSYKCSLMKYDCTSAQFAPLKPTDIATHKLSHNKFPPASKFQWRMPLSHTRQPQGCLLVTENNKPTSLPADPCCLSASPPLSLSPFPLPANSSVLSPPLSTKTVLSSLCGKTSAAAAAAGAAGEGGPSSTIVLRHLVAALRTLCGLTISTVSGSTPRRPPVQHH